MAAFIPTSVELKHHCANSARAVADSPSDYFGSHADRNAVCKRTRCETSKA